MGEPAEQHRRATYADLAAVAPEKIAELIDGELHVFPRPASRHARAAARLQRTLGPFDDDDGLPGGWVILTEPELHFPRLPRPEFDAVVPDLAGWRRERMREMPDVASFTLVPDWICEVLSPSRAAYDRDEKMPLYAQHGVRWAWLIDPLAQQLEVYVLGAGGRWGAASIHGKAERVRAVPFDAVPLPLSVLWAR